MFLYRCYSRVLSSTMSTSVLLSQLRVVYPTVKLIHHKYTTSISCSIKNPQREKTPPPIWILPPRYHLSPNFLENAFWFFFLGRPFDFFFQYRLGADFCWGKSEFCAPPRAAAEGCRWGSNYYIAIKSWTLSDNPQRYTEPPWPSAELCTVPFLETFPG